MKAQIKFQKILSLLTLIIAAVCLVYALCFFSGNLANMLYYRYGNLSSIYARFEGVQDFIDIGQSFVSTFIVLGIIFICIVAVLYITSTHSRRKYYVTNYIAIGLVIAIAATIAVYGIITLSMAVVEFEMIDWEGEFAEVMEWAINRQTGNKVTQNYTVFVLGYMLLAVVLCTAVTWALNLVWKAKLMKGEKALLEAGLVREVA